MNKGKPIDEKQVLDLYLNGMSCSKIGKMLKVSIGKISATLNKNGIKTQNNAQLSLEMRKTVDWNLAIEMYNNNFSLQKIAKHFNKTYDFIREEFLRRKVEIRKPRDCQEMMKKYTHKNIFSPMTNEGAYLLGWIMSDGNITYSNNIRLYLEKTDAYHVEYLARLFTNSPIRTEYRKSTDNSYTGFSVASIRICETLKSIGIEPRKTYKAKDINWDFLHEDQIPYFILGLFEGDGYMSKNHNEMNFIMFESTYLSFKEKFLDKWGIQAKSAKHCSRWSVKELQLVRFSGKGYFRLLTMLYILTPDIFCLKRKKERFIENCVRVANSKSTHKKEAQKSLLAIKG